MPIKEIIEKQVSNFDSPVRPLIDAATEAIINNMVFDVNNSRNDAAITSCLFPESYSEYRKSIPNMTTPCFHSITFDAAPIGKKQPMLSVEISFLIPVIKTEYKRVDALNGKERWVPLPSTSVYTAYEDYKGWKKRGATLELKLGDRSFGEILLSKKTCAEKLLKNSKEIEITPEIRLRYSAVSERRPDGSYRTQIIVKNISGTSTRSNQGTVYNVSIKAAPINSKILPMRVGEVKIHASTTNTYATILQDGSLFATPLVIFDQRRKSPTHGPTIKELSSEKSLMEILNFDESEKAFFDENEKAFIKKHSLDNMLAKIFLSVSQAMPKIERMHLWQLHAIRKYLKMVCRGENKPLVFRAPTGSGKTLVFAVCSILNALITEGNGVKSILTFPTRALTTQQLNEFVAILYHFAANLKKIRIALYMGHESGSNLGSLNPTAVLPNDPIPHITRCPKCDGNDFVAEKPRESLVLPKCNKCGLILDFVALSDRNAEENPPEILVATLDKLFYSVSQSIYSHTLFGADCRQCLSCGAWHIASFKKYQEEGALCRVCGSALNKEKVKSSPSLLVCDEVHSLSGSFGNMTSHLISLLKVINKKYENTDLHFIGATATIANEEVLINNLAGSMPEVLPSDEEFEEYFRDSRELHYRFIVVEPLDKSTRASVTRSVLTIDGFMRNVKALSTKEIKTLMKKIKETYKGDVELKYEQQLVYVNRKRDGSTLEKYFGDVTDKPPHRIFVSGDDSSKAIALKNKSVKEHSVNVVIATKVYSLGMDFADLNILQFFGSPDSMIDLIQIIGRTGRGNTPAIVILHLYPPNPRDNFLYKFFSNVMEAPTEHFEPAPINALNRHAITQSIFNVISALVLAESNTMFQARYCNGAFNHYVTNKNSRKLLDELLEVYKRSFATEQENSDIKQIVTEKLIFFLKEAKGKDADVVTFLNSMKLLQGLRGDTKVVTYENVTHYPLLEFIESDKRWEDEALIEEASGDSHHYHALEGDTDV